MKWKYLIIAAILTSCGSGGPPPPPPVSVEMGKVIQKDAPLFLETIGNIYSPLVVNIRPQVTGKIVKVHVKEGDFVKAGDVLYTIDPSIYEADLERAKATLVKDQAILKFAQQKRDRYIQLVAKDYVAQVTIEELESNVNSALAQEQIDVAAIQVAQINLDYTSVRSPITGKISVFLVDYGNVVVANDPTALTEVRQIDPIEVRFTFSQKNYNDILDHRANLKFDVYPPEGNEKISSGKVTFIDNHIDLATGTLLLFGDVPNEKELLWPGAFVRVRMYTNTIKNAVLAPKEAIQIGQKGPYAFVVKEDMTAEMRAVKTGPALDNMIVIEEGLKPGDNVVTLGQLNLRTGSKVVVK